MKVIHAFTNPVKSNSTVFGISICSQLALHDIHWLIKTHLLYHTNRDNSTYYLKMHTFVHFLTFLCTLVQIFLQLFGGNNFRGNLKIDLRQHPHSTRFFLDFFERAGKLGMDPKCTVKQFYIMPSMFQILNYSFVYAIRV